MKKLLLSIGLGVLGFVANAQTVFNVDYPSSIGGNYDFTYATSASWGVSDITDPANAVTDTIAFVSDGTPGDSLGCNTLTNGADINGKVAVVYRGDCEFGAKAKNAQDQGAVAVVIINNIPGPPVGMAGGTFGTQVTVPVVMVSDETGALLANEAMSGDVVVFIGNKIGRFPNDLSMYQKDVRRPELYGNVSSLSQNASEFNTEMGAWVFNYGVHTQHSVELTCAVKFGGSTIYNNFAMTDSIESGDSVYIGLPDFNQASYNNGYYTIEYSVVSDSSESLPSDNEVVTGFVMNDLQISYGIIDSTTFEPVGQSYYRPAGEVSSYSMCMNFRNANASRLAARGITFSASTYNADDSTVNLVDEYIQIEAFKWEDSFTGITDATVNSLTQIATGEYDYTTDMQRGNVYVDFQEAFALEDNQRYLFCVKTESENVYLGYSTTLDYFANQDTLDQPITVLNSDESLSLRGFGPDVIPAMTIETLPANEVSVEEAEVEETLTAFPNPAKEMISIPVGNVEVTEVVIYDVTGKVVVSQNTNVVNNLLRLDVTTIPNGMYVVALNYENNTTSKINVVVSK
ncbi:MAG: T9SS type A sorting domain-containing protein [Flavobacteriales bacterium]|jgi:hypothetical protein|nr:T9SS type A sorting domain-containing protein [Flavobacteriales bacterium]